VIVVADAGPLIYLSEVGSLHLLRELYGGILVPREVYEEVVVHGQGEPGSSEVASSSWIRVSERPLASLLRLGLLTELDAGEAAAIALAVEENATLVLIDERKGRMVAKRLGLQVRGTLGVLVEAKRRGQVELVGPLLERLIGVGFRISDAIKEEVLRSAGE
jgi:uncharacterized protein